MFTELKSLIEVENVIKAEGFHLLYFSRPACGVCTVLKQKVGTMLENYPDVSSYYINLDEVPEAAGRFSIFTIPAVLIYSSSTELVREARHISMDDLESKLARPYQMSRET